LASPWTGLFFCSNPKEKDLKTIIEKNNVTKVTIACIFRIELLLYTLFRKQNLSVEWGYFFKMFGTIIKPELFIPAH
jgi:hypothetical protein